MNNPDGPRLNGHHLFHIGGSTHSLHCLICNRYFRMTSQAHATPCQSDVTHLLGLPVNDNPALKWAMNPANPAFYLTFCSIRPSRLPKRHGTVPAQPALDGAHVPNLCENCSAVASDPNQTTLWLGVR